MKCLLSYLVTYVLLQQTRRYDFYIISSISFRLHSSAAQIRTTRGSLVCLCRQIALTHLYIFICPMACSTRAMSFSVIPIKSSAAASVVSLPPETAVGQDRVNRIPIGVYQVPQQKTSLKQGKFIWDIGHFGDRKTRLHVPYQASVVNYHLTMQTVECTVT